MASEVLSRLQEHLQALQADPVGTSIDKRLFDEAELVLPNILSLQDLNSVIISLSTALQTVREDATPLTSLLQRLLTPFTFADVLAFEPPIDFVSGLTVAEHMVSVNRLMLYLLAKAKSTADVATIASWPDVVRAFVHLWLSTNDSGTAEQAGALLVDFLKIDRAEVNNIDEMLPEHGSGQGLMWKRLFTDRDVYATFFDDCDLKTGKLGKTRVSLAQARLLEVLPDLAALDWTAVSSSHHADVEGAHGVQENGLLEFAALKMVDYEGDVLTYWVLITFFSQLLRKTKPLSMDRHSSPGLEYLQTAGIHQRIAGIYLNDAGGIESIYLYGPAANYLGTYASLYPAHYRSSPLPDPVQKKLTNALSHSVSRWSNISTAEHDLQLLIQLPRMSILPRDSTSAWSTSPVSLLPSAASSPAVLSALATIFYGPERATVTFPGASSIDSQDERTEEAAAARALYLNYLAHNRKLWSDVVRHADTVALVDSALAAIGLLTSVITANWSADLDLSLPTSVIPTPETGPLAILSPPALEYVLPFLMSPPKTFSNLVGGRGDTESAVYKIAMAKYDALKLFHDRMATYVGATPDSGFEDVVSTLAKRLAEGPFSRAGEVGGRVATVEL